MKFTRVLLPLAALTLAACGNLSHVTKEGTTDNPVWPKIDRSRFNHDGTQFGSWPNWDNVRMIEKGMNKDQLYYLIGRPHFQEGLFGVREWDYVFNYRENGEHKICQYKVLFDKDMNAQSFFWLPENCNQNYELSGDFLFDFDSAELTAEGKKTVEDTVEQIKQSGAKQVVVNGYTDRLGVAAYNLKLSQRRAEAVKAYMVELGIEANSIEAVGLGSVDQVVACSGERGESLKACLKPNRRIVITAK